MFGLATLRPDVSRNAAGHGDVTISEGSAGVRRAADVALGVVGLLLGGRAAFASELAHSGLGWLLGDGVVGVASVVACLVCLIGALTRGRERTVWLAFAVAVGFWGWHAGLVTDSSRALAFPTSGDELAIGFFVAVSCGLVLLVRASVSIDRPSSWVDVALGALAVVAVGSVAALRHVVTSSEVDASALDAHLAYAMADLVLVGFVAAVAVVGRWTFARWPLLVALALLAVGESVYLAGLTSGESTPSSLVTSLWAAGPLVLALGPWTSRAARDAPGRWGGVGTSALPLFAAAAGVCILIARAVSPSVVSHPSVGAAVVLLSLTIVRLGLSMRENAQTTRGCPGVRRTLI
jgi:hypothetical protein